MIYRGIQIILIFLFALGNVTSLAQSVNLQGKVQDSKTKEPLAFCAISIKGSSKGSITNADGVFKIIVNPEQDTLMFSYLGYEVISVPAKSVLQQPVIELVKKDFLLKEVVITSDDSYLYEIIENCRKKMHNSELLKARLYFEVETNKNEKPVELIQAYYNCNFDGVTMDKNLLLKNGRIGLAKEDNGYFLNIETSKALAGIYLIHQNEFFPAIPFQFRVRKLKKLYWLTRHSTADDDNFYHIEFTPKTGNGAFFKGEVWIEKESFSILKIKLQAENAQVHPFLPWPPGGELKNIALKVSMNFDQYNGKPVISFINFDYEMEYKNPKPSVRLNDGSQASYPISSKGLIYIYDYGNPFLLPFYEYAPEHNDYRKISFIPYNDFFWNSNRGLAFTEKQKEKISYFEKNGILLNLGNEVLNTRKDKGIHRNALFQNNNIYWDGRKRVRLEPVSVMNDSPFNQFYQTIFSEFKKIKVQIFLDINQYEDSIQHISFTVLDIFQTQYRLPEEAYANCILNIYFDLCEIERQKMEEQLSTSKSIPEMKEIYRKTVEEMNHTTDVFLKEVLLKKNQVSLKKWNNYVFDYLGIDNLAIMDCNE